MSAFGDKIKQARELKGISQTELAELLGLSSQKVVSTWETGRSKPDIDTLLNVCDILKCSPNFLLLDNDDSEEYSDHEKALISNYRILDRRGQSIVEAVIKSEYAYITSSDISCLADVSKESNDKAIVFLSKKDHDYMLIKTELKKLKSLRSVAPMDYSIIQYKLWEAGYQLSIFDIFSIFQGKKTPTRRLYDYLYSILETNITLMQNK